MRYSLNVYLTSGAVIQIPCWSWEVTITDSPRVFKKVSWRALDNFKAPWLATDTIVAVTVDEIEPLTEAEEIEIEDSGKESLANDRVYV